jgi:hypothetical protein
MPLDGLRHALLDDGERENFLGREMMVEGASRHSGRADDVMGAGGVVAALLKRFRCRIQYAFSDPGGIIRSRAAAGWLLGHEWVRRALDIQTELSH